MTTSTSTRGGRSWLRRAATITLAVLAGLVAVAGIVLWVVPARLEVPEPPELAGPSVVMAADGTRLARFTAQVDRTVVDLDDVSEVARDTIVTAEDAEFREHTGVDPVALLRAIWVNVSTGSIEQGGSTLTQQYVKNTYTGDDVSLRRKLEESMLALAVERHLSKDEILERYLNSVYFGQGASGIEAAARTYFDVPAAELDAAQAALLAQALPAPSERNPVADPTGARARRDALLARMGDRGLLTPSQVASATAQDLGVVERTPDPGRYPYVVQHVRRLLVEEYGEEDVLTGSLEVTTTIQPPAMEALRDSVTERLPHQEGRPGVDAGALAADPATGAVLAWYGGRDHAASQFDLAMQARRRPGSTFKPVAYLAALEDGIGPDEVYDAPRSFDEGELCDPGWGPANAGGGSYGSLPLREGLVRSVNTVFAQVGCDVGAEQLRSTAMRLGVRSELRPTPQLAIGGFGSNTTVASLTQVFGTFANDGVQCPLHTIRRVVDRNGDELAPPDETTPWGRERRPSADLLEERPDEWEADDTDGCHRMAGADDVRRVTDALQDVVDETTGRRADIGRPQAGKTGTTDDEVDAWFAGYTPDLALVVRVGDRVERPLVDIAGFGRVQGGTIPALVWHDAASALLEGVEEQDFPEPAEDTGDHDAESDPTPHDDDGDGEQAPTPAASPSDRESPDDAPDERGGPTDDQTDAGGNGDNGGNGNGNGGNGGNGNGNGEEEEDEDEEEEDCDLLDLPCP